MTVPDRPWSLKRRLMVRMSLLAIVTILGPLAFTLFHASFEIDDLREVALQEQAAEIERAIIGPEGEVRAMPPALMEAYRTAGDNYLFVVRSAGGRVLARSSPHAETLLHQGAYADRRLFLVAPVTGGSWLGYARTVHGLQILVAQNQLHEDVLADSIAWDYAATSLWLTLPLLMAVLGVVYLTLTLMFRRIDQIAAAAAGLVPGLDVTPLPLEGLPREMTGLVHAVNVAFERLSQAYQAEKKFTADAAHELRTPLAVLTARIDTAPPSSERDDLQKDVARVNRVVDQLLQAARLDARPLEGQAIELGPCLLTIVANLAPLAVRQGRDITLDIRGEGPIWVLADAAGLETAITNLIDNALKHTQDGPIDVIAGGDGCIEVCDRGAGIASEDRRLLFERFQRGPRPTTSGSGLGLAIVRQIVEQLGGTVEVSGRPGGGSVFAIRLRLADIPRDAVTSE